VKRVFGEKRGTTTGDDRYMERRISGRLIFPHVFIGE